MITLNKRNWGYEDVEEINRVGVMEQTIYLISPYLKAYLHLYPLYLHEPLCWPKWIWAATTSYQFKWTWYPNVQRLQNCDLWTQRPADLGNKWDLIVPCTLVEREPSELGNVTLHVHWTTRLRYSRDPDADLPWWLGSMIATPIDTGLMTRLRHSRALNWA